MLGVGVAGVEQSRRLLLWKEKVFSSPFSAPLTLPNLLTLQPLSWHACMSEERGDEPSHSSESRKKEREKGESFSIAKS